jgi:hypothetical protein
MKKCIICKKKFIPDKWHPNQRTCASKSCKKELDLQRTHINKCIDCKKEIHIKYKRCQKCYLKYNKGKNNSNYKKGRYCDNPNRCIGCNIPIGKEHIRCKSCARTGNLHPNYINGNSYEPYSLDFNPKLREKIRNRDGNKCVVCGMTKKEHFRKYNRNLEVHHKDHIKVNCNEDNLETRCKLCNIRDNKRRRR